MRKRSTYRPRPVHANPLMRLTKVEAAGRELMLGRCYSAINAMQFGSMPGPDEWSDLSCAVNIVDTMVVGGKLVPAEVLPVLKDAQKALVRANRRYEAGHGMRLDAPGLTAVRAVMEVYEACLLGFTAREMADAVAATQLRMHSEAKRMPAGEEVACV